MNKLNPYTIVKKVGKIVYEGKNGERRIIWMVWWVLFMRGHWTCIKKIDGYEPSSTFPNLQKETNQWCKERSTGKFFLK